MAAGQTALHYNDIVILNCQTNMFEQSAVFDDSDTTLMWTTFRIRVTGYVVGQNVSQLSVGTNFANTISAAATHATIREKLMEPRRGFVMRVGAQADGSGGTVLVAADAAGRVSGAGLDRNNGPKPRNCSITQISGDSLFRIEYEIELALNECAGPRTEVLSNRWSAVDSLDSNLFTTRSISGTLQLASPLNNPHNFRGWVVPPLQPGMRRESMSFTATPDGLKLQYQITDREVNYAPPSPATDWSVSHRESAGEHGITMISSIDVTLQGDRTASPKTLLRLGAAVIEKKILSAFGGFKENRLKLLSWDAFCEQGSNQANRVSVSARFQRVQADAKDGAKGRVLTATRQLGEYLDAQTFQGIIDGNGQPVVYDPDRSPGGRAGEGTYLNGAIPVVGAVVAHMQSLCNPSDPITAVSAGRRAENGANAGGTLPAITVRASEGIPDEKDTRLSVDHNDEGIYTVYNTQVDLDEDEMIVDMPVAGETGTSGGSIYDHETGEYKSTGKATAFAALGPKQTTRVIRVDAERVGKMPRLPEANPKYSDEELKVEMRLKDSKTRVMNPSPQPGGEGYVYRVQAEYRYVPDKPVGAIKVQESGALNSSAGNFSDPNNGFNWCKWIAKTAINTIVR